MYAYSTESCIHLFRNQPASVQRQSPDKENQRFPLVFAGLFSWRGGGGDYSTRVERVDGCDWFIFNLFISNSKKDLVLVIITLKYVRTSAVTWLVVVEVALHCSAVHCIVHYWGSACMYLTFSTWRLPTIQHLTYYKVQSTTSTLQCWPWAYYIRSRFASGRSAMMDARVLVCIITYHKYSVQLYTKQYCNIEVLPNQASSRTIR